MDVNSLSPLYSYYNLLASSYYSYGRIRWLPRSAVRAPTRYVLASCLRDVHALSRRAVVVVGHAASHAPTLHGRHSTPYYFQDNSVLRHKSVDTSFVNGIN